MMQPRDAQHDDGVCAQETANDDAPNHLAGQSRPASSSPAPVATSTADAALFVGARKRKALRVVKHQQTMNSPIKAESEPETQKGNTSMDTGVSSDLSESRPSLGDVDDSLSESGGEYGNSESEASNNEVRRRRRRVKKRAPAGLLGGRKRRLEDEDVDDSRCHSIAKQRITDAQQEPGDVQQHLKCPQCGDAFPCAAHLIQHVQMAHPATLGSSIRQQPTLGAAVQAGAATPAARALLFQHDTMLTSPPEEYKNEEDDPFSAVLREMKSKGEFPCRLCEAVFPNLRALKGHNRNHLTQAPYRCNMCPSTSLDKGALIRHMRTHNGERPYECRDCQYAFTTKANCERHLRNRHGKIGRDAVRASIIYHLSEDGSRQGADHDSDHFYKSPSSPHQSALDLSADAPDNQRRHDDDEGSTDYPSEDEIEQDGPLDLTVDVLDLRKRRREVTSVASASPSIRPAAPVASTPLATPSPSIQAAPAAPEEASVKPTVFAPPYFGSPYPGASLAGLPFFYPGLGGASYSAFLESKLAEMGNPAMDLSALALAAAHHDAIRQAQQQQQVQQVQHQGVEGLLMPVMKKYTEEARSTPVKTEVIKPSSVAKPPAVNNSDPGIKMVLKNGVLVKKQKQRRYRTERPFGCEHCTARFTLRSNMERHIKQQHPDIWSTRPRGHRRSACSLSAKSGNSALPTLVEMKNHVPAMQQQAMPTPGPISDQVRQAVQQKLNNRKGCHSEASEDEEDDEEEEDEEDALVIDEPKEIAPKIEHSQADLASVSKLLTNAVAQSFQQYFNQHREDADSEPPHEAAKMAASPSEGNTDEMDDGECTSISDGSDFGNRSDNQVVKSKKKSAYSNAPHRVSCPYCSRKFPWTSSLRRHILTHTGQKPYKCPQCPLWFTTKSNCDRHLLRKHGNHLRDSANHAQQQSNSGANSGTDSNNSRNVPDRPYKCALCPASTFATSDNLKKHVDNKHCPAHAAMGVSSPESMADDKQPDNEQLPFKCHLCDDSCGFAERQEVLDHLQRDHTDEFHDLVGKVGALVAEPPPMPSAHTSDEGEDYDSIRGKFPDYVNRKVICAFCLRRFWSAEDLRRHMRTHSGERPYQCEVCSRRFTLKHSMLRHRRKHGVAGQQGDETDEDEEEEMSSGSERHNRRHRERAPAKVRMQAVSARAGIKIRGPCGSDLIGNMLGIADTSLVEQLMSKPADDAARLLGVTGGNRA